MKGADWNLVTYLTHTPAKGSKGKQKLLSVTGEQYGSPFRILSGYNFLIHLNGDQLIIFDPTTERDISKPIRTDPEICIFNRSRNSCLTLVDGMAAVLDMLSLSSGETKITTRPQWTEALKAAVKARNNKPQIILTEDAQSLILLTDIKISEYVAATNFTAEKITADGEKQVWLIPHKRDSEVPTDAELVNGKILILIRALLINAAEDEIKLVNTQGETLHSTITPASAVGLLWNPPDHKVLVIPQGFSPTDFSLEFLVWDYESGTLENTTFGRRL
jgi:hypothetical protein